MDGSRFDTWTRSLVARVSSRRRFTGVVAAGLLGRRLGLTGPAEAAACRPAGRSCDRARRCCEGGRCVRGFCRCRISQNFFACDGPGRRCVNVATSEKHCGVCDAPCRPNEICRNGGCVDHCEDGLHNADESDTDCGGDRCPRCAAFKRCGDASDCVTDHCGVDFRCAECSTDAHCTTRPFDICIDHQCKQCRTDAECPRRTTCVDNLCTPHCNNNAHDGDETDVDCGGSCPRKCALNRRCLRDGDCRSDVCVASRCRECRTRDQCTDPSFPFCADNECVECLSGSDCRESAPICSQNRCVECADNPDCPGDRPVCDNGACTTACGEGRIECGSGCCDADTQACCDNACTDIRSDPSNCGSCGNACPSDRPTCCGFCTNTQQDSLNCGGCGNNCRLSNFCPTCCEGACSGFLPPGSPADTGFCQCP